MNPEEWDERGSRVDSFAFYSEAALRWLGSDLKIVSSLDERFNGCWLEHPANGHISDIRICLILYLAHLNIRMYSSNCSNRVFPGNGIISGKEARN